MKIGRGNRRAMPQCLLSFCLLNNLGVVDGVISRDGLRAQELVRRLYNDYERSIQASIEHHSLMMKAAKGLALTGIG